jgi:hypothetical protein
MFVIYFQTSFQIPESQGFRVSDIAIKPIAQEIYI